MYCDAFMNQYFYPPLDICANSIHELKQAADKITSTNLQKYKSRIHTNQ